MFFFCQPFLARARCTRFSITHIIGQSSANPGYALKILEILIVIDDVCLCVNRCQMKEYKSFRV